MDNVIHKCNFSYITWFVLISCLLFPATMSRKLGLDDGYVEPQLILKDHNGPLLKGNLTVNLLWYGKFTSIQRSIIIEFINSLSTKSETSQPSVSSWWQITERYRGGPCTVALREQIFDEHCSLGQQLSPSQLVVLASRLPYKNSINIVLTSADVDTDDFCLFTCGFHGYDVMGKDKTTQFPYAWVGNAEKICPSICAYLGYLPNQIQMSTLETTSLRPPNKDVGVDSMIIELATVLSGVVTNPFDSGYFTKEGQETVHVCWKSSDLFPGLPGKLLIDPSTNASFNTYGIHGRKYLLPAMWDPQTSSCKTQI